jgi:Vam6/Vps39-like protein vacuolar protein sorting-associated protein 39
VIKEVGILVALAGTLQCQDILLIVDSTVTLYDLQTFDLQEHLTKTKGANIFGITSNIEKDSDGVPTIISRLAIIVKRKLIIYSWHDAELIEPEVPSRLPLLMQQEFPLPDRARTLTWMSSSKLCLGLSSDYTILDTSVGTFSDSFSPTTTASSGLGALGGMGVGIGYLGSRAPLPLSVQLPDNQLLLVKDTLSAFLDRDGKLIEHKQIPWQESPERIGWSYPYLITVIGKGVWVWNPDRSKLVQKIELQGTMLLNDGKLLYVASPTHVWRLIPYRYDDQVSSL